MDDHFSKMLAPTAQGNAPSYIPASSYQGSRPGYVFQMNTQGVGYYLDPMQNSAPSIENEEPMGDSKKRKLGDLSTDVKPPVDQNAIEKLLEESENVDIEMLTSDSLKKMLLGFEKKINKNQKLRMKYPDEPEKFMDSEVELHEELNALYALSASPELYPTFVQAGSLQSLLGMVAHENTDISLAAVGLLQELTDPETILENEDTTMVLVDALLAGQCLELIVQNLSRLDESQEEDSQGVHDSLATLENLLEVRSSLALTIAEKTHFFKFLLLRLRADGFDQNKLYCSELLSMLLQNEPTNAKRLANVEGVEDGLDSLLQTVSYYRKRDPESIEEQEYVQNIFLSLNTALMDADNQNRFRSCEGMELMMRCLKENKYAASCACRVITYAVTNNRLNCQRLVSAGGFRYIFPLFMGRSYPPRSKKATKREFESASVSTVGQLCMQLHDVSEEDMSLRLLAKFSENEYEKTDRVAELFVKYHALVAQADRETEQEIAHLSRVAERPGPEGEAAEMELELLEDAGAQYVKRMEAGLHLLQQTSVILAFVCVYNPSNSALITKIQSKLSVEGRSLEDVQAALREFVASIEVSAGGGSSADSDEKITQLTESKRQRQLLIEWSACLLHILQQNDAGK